MANETEDEDFEAFAARGAKKFRMGDLIRVADKTEQRVHRGAYRWQDALEMQMELVRFWESPSGQRYAEAFEGDRLNKGYTQEAFPLVQVESSKLYHADTIVVTDEMMDVYDHARPSFQAEPLQPTDLITPCGFLVLPRPLYVRDMHGIDIPWRAITWRSGIDGVEAPGIHLSTYIHTDDDNDTRRIGLPALTLSAHDLWFYGQSESRRQPIQALFRLLTQYVAVRESVYPGRHWRRRWRRNWHDLSVTVITLRRPKAAHTNAERDVAWSHRWLVSGHWRRQWYPSLGEYRQIYIAPFIKGPDDKPLVIADRRAFKLTR